MVRASVFACLSLSLYSAHVFFRSNCQVCVLASGCRSVSTACLFSQA